MTASATSYSTESRSSVTVTGGNTTTVNLALMSPSIYPSVTDTVRSPGESFVATVNASSVSGLFATGFILNYTQSSFITVKSVESQEFFGNDAVFFSDQSVPGKVGIGVSAKNGAAGASRDGILARVTFQSAANTPENTSVIFSLSNFGAVNSSGQALTLNSARTDTIKIRTPNLTVWPGDMDNDGDVDQADVLKLGVYYGKTGPSRTGGSMTWSGQSCLTWTPREATYADANGDGAVAPTDLMAIGLNWGKTHATTAKFAALLSDTAESISGTLSLQSNAVFPLRAGDEFPVDVTVKDAVSLFGLSFVLSDQSGVITPISAERELSSGTIPFSSRR